MQRTETRAGRLNRLFIPLALKMAGQILMILCLGLCLMLCSCTTTVYVPVVEVIAPPAVLYLPKPIPDPPVAMGQPMTVRQMAAWTSRLLEWAGEACADREAMRLWVERMQREVRDMGKKS